jgi:protein-L-isoaspartate(D-aspartate) O-methyltransferase
MDLDLRRRFYAEELEAVCNLKSRGLVDALATVPRERYLPPGPWTTLDTGEGYMMGGPPRALTTPDANPARVYHNIGIAIDPTRQLFNGQPGTLAVWLDVLGLAPGARVLHIGCGLGYYTALMAHAVGATGRVLALDVDKWLADAAGRNLSATPWVEVRHSDGATARFDEQFDVILVNAGVTHPLPAWLAASAPGGRMILPLTGTTPAMRGPIGKGVTWLLTRQDDATFTTRPIGVVAIYSAIGVRDEAMNARVGRALMGGPAQWAAVKRLRLDAHDDGESCWLHGDGWCWNKT